MTKKSAYQLTQSQKMMIFILSMSFYGLSNMFTELIPQCSSVLLNYQWNILHSSH